MRISRSLAVSAALSLVLAVGAPSLSHAQEEAGEAVRKSRRTEAAATARASVETISDLIGYTVKNRKGEKIGAIDELVISPEDGRIVYALMSFGGVLGIGDTLIAVSWRDLELNGKEKVFVLDAEETQLERAPAVDRDKLPRIAPPLHRSTEIETRGAVPQEVAGAREKEGLATAREGNALPFSVKKGDRFAFHVSSSLRTTAARESAPDSIKSQGREYRLMVQDVSRTGEMTLLVAFNGAHQRRGGAGAEGDEAQAERVSDAESSSKRNSNSVTTVTLGPDGRVKRSAGSALPIPRELESHFQFIFGSGLHVETLKAGEVYTLAPLYQGAGEGGGALKHRGSIHLRFEGANLDGDSETVRFTVVARHDGAPVPSGARSDQGDLRSSVVEEISPTTPGERGKPTDRAQWRTVGQAVYRAKDGFLERLSLNGDPRLQAAPVADSGAVTSILRIQSVP